MTNRVFPQGFYRPEPGSSQILLIRHGQSAPYVSGRPFPLVDGHGDPELTDLGHAQARMVADRLQSEPIVAIYASTLTRTHQTAHPLAQRLGLEPIVEPDLREVHLGQFEGGRFREMAADNHPQVQRLRQTGDWGSVTGAESNAELTARTVSAVLRIAENHRDQMVAAFCHGGVIGAVLSYVVGADPLAFFGARHTSVNHVVVEPNAGFDPDGGTRQGWVLRSFNDGAHAGSLTGDHEPG